MVASEFVRSLKSLHKRNRRVGNRVDFYRRSTRGREKLCGCHCYGEDVGDMSCDISKAYNYGLRQFIPSSMVWVVRYCFDYIARC